FSGFNRTFGLFSASRIRGTQRVALDRTFQTNPLVRNKSIQRVAFARLTCQCILHAVPRIQGHHWPVAAECQMPACVLYAMPRPCALGPPGASVARPNF